MTREQINTYTLRISQANTSALAVVLYDMILDDMEEGQAAYDAGNSEQFENVVKQAQNFLQELMCMSKMDTSVGCDVMSIYLYVNKQFLLSIVRRRPVEWNVCREAMEKLRSSFQKISETDYDAPLMEHTQQVYAGLTYSKGYLNESCDPLELQSRGLQA